MNLEVKKFNTHINVRRISISFKPSVMASSWSLPKGEPRSEKRYTFFSHFLPLKSINKIGLNGFYTHFNLISQNNILKKLTENNN